MMDIYICTVVVTDDWTTQTEVIICVNQVQQSFSGHLSLILFFSSLFLFFSLVPSFLSFFFPLFLLTL